MSFGYTQTTLVTMRQTPLLQDFFFGYDNRCPRALVKELKKINFSIENSTLLKFKKLIAQVLINFYFIWNL
jgi:hypothetical protein